MDAKAKKAVLDMIAYYLDHPDEEKLKTCINMLSWQLHKEMDKEKKP